MVVKSPSRMLLTDVSGDADAFIMQFSYVSSYLSSLVSSDVCIMNASGHTTYDAW